MNAFVVFLKGGHSCMLIIGGALYVKGYNMVGYMTREPTSDKERAFVAKLFTVIDPSFP